MILFFVLTNMTRGMPLSPVMNMRLISLVAFVIDSTVVARRLSPGTSTDADTLVLAKGSGNRIDNLHDDSLWRQNEAVMVYLREPVARP